MTPNKIKEICNKCNREITNNLCSIHKTNEKCYYCHLVSDHISNYVNEVDGKKPVKPKKETKPKEKSNKTTTFADNLDKNDGSKDKSYGFSNDKDDDRGIYS